MKIKEFINDWIIPIGIAVIIALLLNNFVFRIVKIPTGSMEPTIMVGDRAFVTRIYNFDKLQRKDIIVFKSQEPDTKNELFIKRLIGLPGDEIITKADGSVYVNGEKLDEPYIGNNGSVDGTFKVPEGHYFFMGDNREFSFDARYWKNKYISKDEIVGKAKFKVWPFNRVGKLK